MQNTFGAARELGPSPTIAIYLASNHPLLQHIPVRHPSSALLPLFATCRLQDRYIPHIIVWSNIYACQIHVVPKYSCSYTIVIPPQSFPALNMSHIPPSQQPLPDPRSLIKPDQVAQIKHFTDQQRANYTAGITKLWGQMKLPEGHPDHVAAHKKLAEVTNNIKLSMKKNQTEQVQQQNGTRPVSQGQPTQQDIRPSTGAPPQAREAFSESTMRNLRSQSFIVPPNVSAQGQEASQQWVRDAQHKFAQHYQRYEQSSNKLNELSQLASTRQAQGKPFSAEEEQKVNHHKHSFQRSQQESKDYLNKFRSQQESYKQHQNQIGNLGMTPPPNPNSQVPISDHSHSVDVGLQSTQPQVPSEHQGQPHTVSSALDAARNQAGSTNRPTMSPATSGPQGPPLMNPGPTSQNGVAQGQPQNSHPNLNINTGTGQSHQIHSSPQVANPHSAPPSQGPHPLSHRAAVDQAARSYAQPNYQQSTPQSSTHAHPQMGNRDPQNNNNVKMPIPKDLKIPQPQPVAMGPARPTLTGGPSNGAQGSMGQPAIQKHPGYVLEGEGERVLSKKKLQELVRQVTGGGGGEGEEEEGLTAEVEEVALRYCSCSRISFSNRQGRLFSKSPTTSSTRSLSVHAVSLSFVRLRPSNSATSS